MTSRINAFVLAAGLGERLRPLTLHTPKPLLPIVGMRMIDRVIEKIERLQVGRICVNACYKPDLFRLWHDASPLRDRITLLVEDPVLGTGGALKNAGIHLGGSPFLVHNADILTDLNISDLARQHLGSGNLVTLGVIDHLGINNVWIDRSGMVVSVGTRPVKRKGLKAVTFSGVAMYSPAFLDLLPDGPTSVIDAWTRAISSGLKIGTIDYAGCQWTDIGTPEAYVSAVFKMLNQDGETLFIDPSVDCSIAEIHSNVVIEAGSSIQGRAALRHCIILPGAHVRDGQVVENAVLGPDYSLAIDEPLTIPRVMSSDLLSGFLSAGTGPSTVRLIGQGGSDRRYYRVSEGSRSAVLMESSHYDTDFQRQIIYTEFFEGNGLPVPAFLGADGLSPSPHAPVRKTAHYAMFEDLGDISLYTWLKCRREAAEVEEIYKKVLDAVILLHTKVTERANDCLMLKLRVFDHDHLRWETDYFMKRFVFLRIEKGTLPASFYKGLYAEFDSLAQHVSTFPKTIVHRDLQSQNIMILKDAPVLIDYQGARMGPPAYDIASLLWDPYYRLEDRMRQRLLEHYISGRKAAEGSGFDEMGFRETLLPCRLQRHMQALGAYGYLSMEKGKRYFLKFVPEAISYLSEEAVLAGRGYPLLSRLVVELHGRA